METLKKDALALVDEGNKTRGRRSAKQDPTHDSDMYIAAQVQQVGGATLGAHCPTRK